MIRRQNHRAELARLADAGVLRKTAVGTQIMYQAEKDCPVIEELRSILLKTSAQVAEKHKLIDKQMDSVIEKYRQQILALARENGVCNVRVFGSMARNEAGPESDLDLLVDIENGQSGLALGGFLADVAALVHRKVDVVTEKSFHPSLDPLM